MPATRRRTTPTPRPRRTRPPRASARPPRPCWYSFAERTRARPVIALTPHVMSTLADGCDGGSGPDARAVGGRAGVAGHRPGRAAPTCRRAAISHGGAAPRWRIWGAAAAGCGLTPARARALPRALVSSRGWAGRQQGRHPRTRRSWTARRPTTTMPRASTRTWTTRTRRPRRTTRRRTGCCASTSGYDAARAPHAGDLSHANGGGNLERMRGGWRRSNATGADGSCPSRTAL